MNLRALGVAMIAGGFVTSCTPGSIPSWGSSTPSSGVRAGPGGSALGDLFRGPTLPDSPGATAPGWACFRMDPGPSHDNCSGSVDDCRQRRAEYLEDAAGSGATAGECIPKGDVPVHCYRATVVGTGASQRSCSDTAAACDSERAATVEESKRSHRFEGIGECRPSG